MNFLANLALKLRGSLNQGGDYDYIPAKAMGNHIPKIIHQTYYHKNLPVEIQQNVNYLKSLNPDWEYRLYDDNDIEAYIEKHYPQLLRIYNKINPTYGAAKADFFRYILIYNEGGLYLDIKSSLQSPLNQILLPTDRYLLSHWQNEPGQIHENLGHQNGVDHVHGEFQQWYIAATEGHPFLKAVIENVCNNIEKYNPFIHDTGQWGTLNLTGPIAYTSTILPLLEKHPHRLERDNSRYGFVYSIYESKGTRLGHIQLSKKHYTLSNESIVKLNYVSGFFFNLCQPIYIFAKNYLRSLKN